MWDILPELPALVDQNFLQAACAVPGIVTFWNINGLYLPDHSGLFYNDMAMKDNFQTFPEEALPQ